MSIESVMPSNYPILCHPLLRLPSIFPSIRVFPNELSPWTKRPKYWSFSFSISPFNECSELISFRIDWFDLLAVQGTLKSLLQHHSWKASILWHSAFFMVQLSQSDMTWQSHGLQYAKLPCPSPSPRVCPSSCPLHQWCHPTISPSVTLFSFCLQSFPATRSFPMSQLFASGGQSTGASAPVLPMSIQGWFPLRLTGLISLLSKGLTRVFSSTTVWKHQCFGTLPSLWSSSPNHIWLLERP